MASAHRNSGDSVVNVARFLPEMAARNPDHSAVKVAVGRNWDGSILYDERSFSTLNRLADAGARYLESEGIGRQTRVLLLVRPGLELITLSFALFKIGAVPVVIDPGMGIRNFLNCVQSTAPEALIGIPRGVLLSRVAGRSFQSVRIRIPIHPKGAFFRKLAAWESDDAYPLCATTSRDPAAILFTSGSTGPAKGVCYEHGMFEAQVQLIRDGYGIEPGEIDLPMLPVFALFNPAMGMTTVVPEMNPSRPARVDPEKIVRAIQQNGVTNSFGSPVLWKKIGRYCLENRIRLPSLRRVLMAGAPVAPEIIELFKDVLVDGEVHTPYGATEALPITSLSGREILQDTWKETEKGKGTCVGKPFPGMAVAVIPCVEDAIVNWSEVTPLPAGEVGEICVKGPVVTHSYFRKEAATARAKIADRECGEIWHRMGDLGYLDARGTLWFCGRKAERVEMESGMRLYTDCCEAVFNRHPKVYRSALVGVERNGRVTPVLVVEPEQRHFPKKARDREIMEKELTELGAEHAHTHLIRTFSFRRKFPVDVRHNAKIHRLKMKQALEKD